MSTQEISKWHGMWKDDRGRFVEIQKFETRDGIASGFFYEPVGSKRDGSQAIQLYLNGNHMLDGSRLMERKRGEEKGWPL